MDVTRFPEKFVVIPSANLASTAAGFFFSFPFSAKDRGDMFFRNILPSPNYRCRYKAILFIVIAARTLNPALSAFSSCHVLLRINDR
jgi:hypothetical protein